MCLIIISNINSTCNEYTKSKPYNHPGYIAYCKYCTVYMKSDCGTTAFYYFITKMWYSTQYENNWWSTELCTVLYWPLWCTGKLLLHSAVLSCQTFIIMYQYIFIWLEFYNPSYNFVYFCLWLDKLHHIRDHQNWLKLFLSILWDMDNF